MAAGSSSGLRAASLGGSSIDVGEGIVKSHSNPSLRAEFWQASEKETCLASVTKREGTLTQMPWSDLTLSIALVVVTFFFK